MAWKGTLIHGQSCLVTENQNLSLRSHQPGGGARRIFIGIQQPL